MKKRMSFVLLIVMAAVCFFSYDLLNKEKDILYVSDENLEWDSIKQIEIYGAGLDQVPPTTIITEETFVKKLVNAVRETEKYQEIPEERWREGTMSLWLRFDNGVVIGLYDNVNYGYIGMNFEGVGRAPFYQFPSTFYNLVLECAKETDCTVVIKSGENIYKPYKNYVWDYTWSEYGWVSADYFRARYRFDEIRDDLPEVIYGDEFEILCSKSVNHVRTTIYDETYELIYRYEEPSISDELDTGIYYISVEVNEQGKFVEDGGDYEAFGYECVYRMIVQ